MVTGASTPRAIRTAAASIWGCREEADRFNILDMKRPTIYDVAREAGVSASTVSRAYARPGRVNAETAQLIFQAAQRLGYRSEKVSLHAGDQPRHAIALVVA